MLYIPLEMGIDFDGTVDVFLSDIFRKTSPLSELRCTFTAVICTLTEEIVGLSGEQARN